jgi:hypothetical protein
MLPSTQHVLACERRLGSDCVKVLLNMSAQKQWVPTGYAAHERLLSTYLDSDNSAGKTVLLRENEGLILREAVVSHPPSRPRGAKQGA